MVTDQAKYNLNFIFIYINRFTKNTVDLKCFTAHLEKDRKEKGKTNNR